MNSRIGRKLLISVIMCLALTVAIVNTVTIFRATAHSNSLMLMQARSGLNIIMHRLEEHLNRFEDIYNTLELSGTISQENVFNANATGANAKETESDFAAFYNEEGKVYWQTGNYNLADISLDRIGGAGYKGFVNDSRAGLTIQLTKPVKVNGIVRGAVVVGMKMDNNSWIDQIKLELGNEVTIFSGTTRYATTILDENEERLVGSEMPEYVSEALFNGIGEYEGTAEINGQKHYVCYSVFNDIDENPAGAYLAALSSAESDKLKASMILTSIIVAVCVAAVFLFIISFISIRIILKPIQAAERLADCMSRGDLDEPDVDFKFGNDELGDFVHKLEKTKHNLNNYIKDIKYVLGNMAEGNFTAQPRIHYVGNFIAISESFAKIEQSLNEIISHIGVSSNDVMIGSLQIAEGSKSLADGTTRQAAAIEELSATINEIAEKVQKTADNASEANKVSQSGIDKIEYQNGEVERMLQAMDDIKKRSDEIQNIIKSIDDIAFQTNILALNAAVEAARAGEAGKGFAVVADEVGSLAAKSAEAAQQTGELIGATIEAVGKGIAIAQTTAATMKEVTKLSDKTNSYIEDISIASGEQADAIIQIKIGIEQISTVVQQNSATAEETAASCSVLSEQSSKLEEEIGKLKV